MNRKFFILISSIVLFTVIASAQSSLREFTLSVVDTNRAELEQLNQLYNWVTSNIRFDTKAYKKFESHKNSAEEILRQRKGQSADYTLLMSEMSRSIGIDCYSVKVYAKIFPYYRNKPFLRANYTINCAYADSAWVLFDACNGSGNLILQPSLIGRVAYKIFKLPYANKKLVFKQAQKPACFDIPPDSLVSDKYPIDPKWLNSATPLSFYYFENDTMPRFTEYSTYRYELENLRKQGEVSTDLVDGINGHKFNAHNFFDLASGYTSASKSYDIERPVTESNLWQFEKYSSDYSIILNSINRHRVINDSVYRERTKSLKTLAADQKRLTGKIKSKSKTAKKSFKSGKKQVVGKNSSYRKKQEAYMINIGRIELKKISPTQKHDSAAIDETEIKELSEQLKLVQLQESAASDIADSLNRVIDKHFDADALYDDSIYVKNGRFNFNIQSLCYMIQSGDEMIIRNYVDSLKYNYSEILDLFEQKKTTKSKVQETSGAYFAQANLYQKLLKEEIGILNKLYKLTNTSDSIALIQNNRIEELIKSYNQSIAFTRKLANHNELQKDIRKNNLVALKEQSKNINRENKFFVAWYNVLYNFENKKYLSEKELIKTIKSDAQKGLEITDTKIRKFKTVN